MKQKKFNGRFSYKTDIGKVRLLNEDESRILVNAHNDVLMVVCDGMGGNKKGDYASHNIIKALTDSFSSKKVFFGVKSVKLWINHVLHNVNKEIYNLGSSSEEYKSMGSTVVIAFLHKDKLIVANCGDSRCYILNKDEFKQVSEDHTYVNYLYNSGQINKEDIKTHPKRHLLTNAIGIYPSLSIEYKVLNYNKETILLCSDGLYNNIKENDIENILRTDVESSEKTENLINLANFNGGSDNISIALWECIDD